MPLHYDALILGSGFAGSLLGSILARQGWKVLIVDPSRHPRFAVGESSTPTADALIAYLAERWDLPELAPLACWGTWTKHYPSVVCGKKRGFSYYRHHRNCEFADDSLHTQSLLVAASRDDYCSDTHWLRSSVDHFLAQHAVRRGAELQEGARATRAQYDRYDHRWSVCIEGADGLQTIHSRWLIDASGSGLASAAFVDNPSCDHLMRTRTRAVFAHYADVKPFHDRCGEDDPFCGDDAAQHHLLDDGWIWMLRMSNGVTSVGLVEPHPLSASDTGLPGGCVAGAGGANEYLRRKFELYPSIARLMADARLVAPQGGPVYSNRLSRCRTRGCGDGWVMLPSAFGFIDPLHSTGIAHSLSGVARIAAALLGPRTRTGAALNRYEQELQREMRWLDTLVAGCYRALPSFARFTTYASLYFIAAIQFEAAMASDPMHPVAGPARWPAGFLHSGDTEFALAVERIWMLVDQKNVNDAEFTAFVRKTLAPWNAAGLLDPQQNNRYHHTAAPKYASHGAGD